MYKAIIVFILALLAASLMDSGDALETANLYATTPYDRCMAAHEGTPAAKQCEFLK